MGSVRVVLFVSKTLKNGKHPIMLRLTANRKSKYVSLSQSSSKVNWDFNKEYPKRKHPFYVELSILIDAKTSSAKKAIMELEALDENYSLEDLARKITLKAKPITLFEYIDDLTASMIGRGKVGNASVYKDTKRVISNFKEGKDILLGSINVPFLKNLEAHLLLSNKGNTVNLYLRTLRAILNKAIEEDILAKERSPFSGYSISHLKNETMKKAISKSDVDKIKEFDTQGVVALQLAKEYFLFSYYCRGMNFKDIAFIQSKSLTKKDNLWQLTYIRSKTGKLFSYSLHPEASILVDKYFEERTNNYLFPFLDKERHQRSVTIFNRLKKTKYQLNKNLKLLASSLGIDEDITTYSARHTFATVLKRSSVGTSKISEMMGHKTEATTQTYLDSFMDDDLYEASLKL